MWWIVLLLLIMAIGALLWWRNIEERKWQLEMTYLTRYEEHLKHSKVSSSAPAPVSLLKSIVRKLAVRRSQQQQKVQSSAESQHSLQKVPAAPVEIASATSEQNVQAEPDAMDSVASKSQLPIKHPLARQITVTEASPKPLKAETPHPATLDKEYLHSKAKTAEEMPEANSTQLPIADSFSTQKMQSSVENKTESEPKVVDVSNTDKELIADTEEESTTEKILVSSEEVAEPAVVFNQKKKLEVITLAEATRKVATHPLTDAVAESAPALEVIQINWQHKPVNSQKQQNRHAREITPDDPALNRVRLHTKAEQAALLKARALKNFDLNDLQQANQRKLGNSVGAPSHLAHAANSLSAHAHHEPRQHSDHNGVHVINEEDIRLNLLRQRLARQRHQETSTHANSGYSVPVIAEDEIYANLAKTDSPLNKQKFQRPVVRESVIPAAARIGKRHAVRMTTPVADMSAVSPYTGVAGSEHTPLSTRFTPFQQMPAAMAAAPVVTVPSADDSFSVDDDYTPSVFDEDEHRDSIMHDADPSVGNQFQYAPDIPPPVSGISSDTGYTNTTSFSDLNPTHNAVVSYTDEESSKEVDVVENPVLATEDPYFNDSEEQKEVPSFYSEQAAAEEKNTDVEVSDYWLPDAVGVNESETTPDSVPEQVQKSLSETEPEVRSVSVVTRLNQQPLPTEQINSSATQAQTAIGMALRKALNRNASHQSIPAPSLKPLLPGMDLLLPPYYDPAARQSEETLLENGITIEEKLAEFKVKVRVIDAFAGPVITRYEIEPAQGVRGSQVVNLEKDLARSLGFASIRVVETIPGKTCMGLELPNPKRQIIRLSEIFSAPVFQQSRSKLTLALGQGITGQPVVTDLAKAPHLLVAGTTGSGKSVGVNAMILSMLFKATPEDVRLIMIDPKMLELSIYEGIPHLLAPVVTDMKLAANALTWCVNEMEKRYRLMSHAGVRNLAGFNQKIAELAAQNKKLFNPFSLNRDDPEPLEKLPYIVVVVDEFADLMMTAGKKIEELIARLAQKARAAGIHLILATQRPSVDVITGLIKANIPTRIAFQVSSKVDSRTILDQMGAENLLGQGDMLFLPPGTAYPERVHGAFVADEEVHRVVHYLKQFGEPKYIDDILTAGVSDDDMFSNASPRNSEEELDPLYDEAVALVVKTRKASISSVQRQLRIGYNRAARLVEQMESEGIVSAAEGNGNRTVLAPQNNHLDD